VDCGRDDGDNDGKVEGVGEGESELSPPVGVGAATEAGCFQEREVGVVSRAVACGRGRFSSEDGDHGQN